MAHELTIRKSGKVEMGFLAGTDRWHGLGNELVAGATIEQWITAAGMDWKVQRSKVRYATTAPVDGAMTQPPLEVWGDQHVLFRSDTKAQRIAREAHELAVCLGAPLDSTLGEQRDGPRCLVHAALLSIVLAAVLVAAFMWGFK